MRTREQNEQERLEAKESAQRTINQHSRSNNMHRLTQHADASDDQKDNEAVDQLPAKNFHQHIRHQRRRSREVHEEDDEEKEKEEDEHLFFAGQAFRSAEVHTSVKIFSLHF
jgi:hypothetical protein